MKNKDFFPVWRKGVTCPNCGTKRLIDFFQKKCKCPNCKVIYTIRW